MVSKVYSAMLSGTMAKVVTVEADISSGLPTMEMTGNLSPSVRDGKERIRVAIKKSGFDFPQGRITINISPAGVRKDGTAFDLAMALSILLDCGAIREEGLGDALVIGELGLDGRILGVRGALPIAIAAKNSGFKRLLLSKENYNEAALVKEIEVVGASSLNELVGIINGRTGMSQDMQMSEADGCGGPERTMDFSEICGQETAKYAIMTAVCGMHNILLMGPPGAGKTMLASRIPSIMPDLSYDESINLTGIYSLAGMLGKDGGIIKKRPFRTPHHAVTTPAMTGGGVPVIPGECSLASKGVLFLDELTKFNVEVLEALREPLEEKRIVINRMSGTYEFPADFMLVSALNPCKCGYYPDRNKCRCSVIDVKRHLGRISKPLLDRIDISVAVKKLEFDEIAVREGKIKSSALFSDSESMRELVKNTWETETGRFKDNRFNSQMSAEEIKKYCELDKTSEELLRMAYDTYDLSARAYHKILKVARTLADMKGRYKISEEEVLTAISYRVYEGVKEE